MKKGQVAVFIILAIFLVLFILILFFIPRNIQEPEEPEADKVHFYVQTLIEDEAFNCLQVVGEQGGYYKIPSPLHVNKTAYWYYEGINIQPFIKNIEDETATCLDEILKNSTNELLEVFGNESLKISGDGIKSSVKINDWRTEVEVDYPIAVSKGGSTSLISDFRVEYRLNLLKIYELATGIVNYASIPEFDKCAPTQNCYSEDINFSFFNDGDDLFIKGQTFAVFSNQTKEEPYELRFAVKRPIKEAFGNDKKRLAVLYQDDGELETFGGRTIEVLNNLELSEGDYYNCEGISEFITKINNYDVVIITGNLQFQIVKYTLLDKISGKETEGVSEGGHPADLGELIRGCNEFNSEERKSVLKNWVNSGGVLWINNVKKYETDNFAVSYIGYLGYKGGSWKPIDLADVTGSLLNNIEEERDVVALSDIKQKEHPILSCPNDISQKIIGTWRSYPLEVTTNDKIIVGSQDEAILWIRELGKGYIVFDEFLLKDNLYERTGYQDDLYSKGMAEEYFVNVLNYLAKSKQYRQNQLSLSLVYPLDDGKIESPVFYFKTYFGKSNKYNLLITDRSGIVKIVNLDGSTITETLENTLKIDLTNSSLWNELEEGRYEWQIKTNGSFSDIGSFEKVVLPASRTDTGEETNEN